VRRALLAVLMTALPFTAAAQVREAVTVEVVEVPVYVVGPDGIPVRNLPREAFELRVDGRKQRIDYFDQVDFGAVPPEGTPAPASRERRLYLFLFDLCFSNPAHLARAQSAAIESLVSSNAATDLFAVATYLPDSGVKFVTPFLRDHAAIRRAIDALRPSEAGDVLGMGVSAAEQTEWQQTGDSGNDHDHGAATEMASALRGGAANQDVLSEEGRRLVEYQLKGLSAAAERLAAMEGQKHVVVFSDGFKAGLLTDVKATRLQWALKDMVRSFRAVGAFLHTIDIAGVRQSLATVEETNDGLRIIAHATNGEFVHNRNDLHEALTTLTTGQQLVYILGFQRRGGANATGSIDVHVNGLARGTRVTFRPGFGRLPPRKELDRLQLADILLNDTPQSGLTVNVSAAASELTVSVPRDELTADAYALIYVFDAAGAMLHSGTGTLTAAAPAWHEPLPPAGGAQTIKVLVYLRDTMLLGYRTIKR
jgi:VWFA-related protein